jgi:hypothetical protein
MADLKDVAINRAITILHPHPRQNRDSFFFHFLNMRLCLFMVYPLPDKGLGRPYRSIRMSFLKKQAS